MGGFGGTLRPCVFQPDTKECLMHRDKASVSDDLGMKMGWYNRRKSGKKREILFRKEAIHLSNLALCIK